MVRVTVRVRIRIRIRIRIRARVILHNLMKESGINLEDTCLIHEDNDGSRRLAMNGMGQKKA